MKNKNKGIRKLIEENFSQKEDFADDVYEEDNLVKRTVGEILDEKIEEIPITDAIGNFDVFKSKSFPADDILSSKTYHGKQVSRKSLETDSEDDNVDELDESDVEDDSDSEDDISDDSVVSNSGSVQEESDLESEEETQDRSSADESEIEDDLSDDETDNASFVYSKAVRDESSDRKKGEAIRTQLNLCEVLLESRITLQKIVSDVNRLPKPENYNEIWSLSSEDEKKSVIQCREAIWDLLEKVLHFQRTFRKQCPEFLDTLNEVNRKEYEEEETSELKIKRRKISEYPIILDEIHNQYTPYRNAVIQKWNDRTKIASGKLAKTNFSAFDLPIVEQINQIFADKQRLIEKTCIKRSDYQIIGTRENTNNEKTVSSNPDHDEEIFDDDDFYHKLLRDYIERKTADVSDPTQLGRKWIKLQSLRSKMKRKIDTRRTKGRKIKFDVHPKLLNFMAPVTTNPWTDTAVNELYNSVFGNKLITS